MEAGPDAGGYPVRAELPGIVADVVATVGDLVGAGDPLVLLDSMKMEIPVLTPCAGIVRRVVVGPGDRVVQGDLVAVLWPDQSSGDRAVC